MIQKWQKKPIPAFEAIQLTNDNWEEVVLFTFVGTFPDRHWLGASHIASLSIDYKHFATIEGKCILVPTQNGVIAMFEGEWIVKTENGNLFRFSDDEFKKLHKLADN